MKKQSLLDNNQLMPSSQSHRQSIQAVHSYQEYVRISNDNLNKSGILSLVTRFLKEVF